MELKHILTLFVLGLFIFGTTESVFAARYGSPSKGQGSGQIAAQLDVDQGTSNLQPAVNQIRQDFQKGAQGVRDACKYDESGEVCQRYLNDMRAYLNSIIDHFKERLTKVGDEFKELDVEGDRTSLESVDTLIQQLTALQTQVQAAKTREDFRTIRVNLKDLAEETKKVFKNVGDKLRDKRYSHVLGASQKIADKLDAMIPRLRQKHDPDKVAQLQQLTDELKSHIQAFRDLVQSGDKEAVKNAAKSLQRVVQRIKQELRDIQQKNDQQPEPVVPTTPVPLQPQGVTN
jgi:ElaB/YqjD/DUF883 family membrane-anchored ribosome-binding protein